MFGSRKCEPGLSIFLFGARLTKGYELQKPGRQICFVMFVVRASGIYRRDEKIGARSWRRQGALMSLLRREWDKKVSYDRVFCNPVSIKTSISRFS